MVQHKTFLSLKNVISQETNEWCDLSEWRPYCHKANIWMKTGKNQAEPECLKILRDIWGHYQDPENG